MGAQIANQPSTDWKVPNGARRGTTAPVRSGKPTDSRASNGSHATSEVRLPSIETSTCWPSPVRSACITAARVPITANSGATRSPIGRPNRTGASPGSPAVIMTPLSAWMIVSIALPSPGTPCAPKPLIEV